LNFCFNFWTFTLFFSEWDNLSLLFLKFHLFYAHFLLWQNSKMEWNIGEKYLRTLEETWNWKSKVADLNYSTWIRSSSPRFKLIVKSNQVDSSESLWWIATESASAASSWYSVWCFYCVMSDESFSVLTFVKFGFSCTVKDTYNT